MSRDGEDRVRVGENVRLRGRSEDDQKTRVANYPPILFFTVGLPGSGKSTFSAKLEGTGVKRVSRDDERNEYGVFDWRKEEHVVELIKNKVMLHLLSEKDVIVDSTNVTVQDRAVISSWAHTLWMRHRLLVRKTCLYFQCPVMTSIERRAQTIREEVIHNMHARFVVPHPFEGFVVKQVDAMRTETFSVDDREILKTREEYIYASDQIYRD